MEIKSGIYVIENIVNGKKYVGQSCNLEKRMWDSHIGCPTIYNAIENYGKENFKRYIIINCNESELRNLEIYYIKKLHSHVSEGGYNISAGGMPGFPRPNFSGENHPRFGKKLLNASSAYYGVSKVIQKREHDYIYWIFSIVVNKKQFHSKKYKLEIEAAKAYDKYVVENKLPNPLNYIKNELGIKKKRKNPSSQYSGVYKYLNGKQYAYWRSVLRLNGNNVNIGNFKTELEAAKAYDKYIIENNLNRPLNFLENYNK